MTALFYSTDREHYAIDELIADTAWFSFSVSVSFFDIGQPELMKIVHRGMQNTLVALR